MLYKQINGIVAAFLDTDGTKITEHEFLYSLSKPGFCIWMGGVGFLWLRKKNDLH